MTNDLTKQVEEMNAKEQAAIQVGERAAKYILSRILPNDTAHLSQALGAILCALDKADTDRDCTSLRHEWMMDHFWGPELHEASGQFEELHTKLAELGATFEDRLVYGDIDVGVWAGEFTDGSKYIGHECYCSCADDNVHIYFRDRMNFHCRKMTPKEAKKVVRNGSINHYGDGRDNGFCFSVEIWDFSELGEPIRIRAKDTLAFYHRVYWALWNLRGIFDGIDHPCTLTGNK